MVLRGEGGVLERVEDVLFGSPHLCDPQLWARQMGGPYFSPSEKTLSGPGVRVGGMKEVAGAHQVPRVTSTVKP